MRNIHYLLHCVHPLPIFLVLFFPVLSWQHYGILLRQGLHFLLTTTFDLFSFASISLASKTLEGDSGRDSGITIVIYMY